MPANSSAPKITLVWRSDAHLADVAPQARIDDWAAAILDKTAQVGEIARKVGAVAVLDGGDFFHVKSPSRNSHELVRRAAEIHAKYPCPVYACPGNHDVKYGSLEYLAEAPLSVLYETGVFHRLYDEHEAVFEAGDFIGMQGEQMVNGSSGFRNKLSVRVVGIPYHGVLYDMNRFSTILKGSEDWLVAVVHCLASPSGGTIYESEDVLKYADLSNLAPDIWLLGHSHVNQGVQKVGGKWLINIGSFSRGALNQDDLSRQPSVAVLDFDAAGIKVDVVPLKVRPAAEVFDLEGRIRVESRKMSMDALVDSIQVTLVSRPEGSLLDTVRALPGVPDLVRERSLAYLEAAGGK